LYEFMAAMHANPDMLVEADLDARSTVIDAGAYDGEWSARVLARYGCTIYAFEPDPFSFARLEERLGGEPNVRLFEHGLGASDGTATLTIAGPGSSMYEVESPFGTTEVRVRDVADVLDELDVESVDLLKVNIEGGEYDVLDRLAATGWLGRTRYVSVQFHEWHPKSYARRRANRRALRRDHEEQWSYPWVWELWRHRDDRARS
jgi:FkbM family methyltransferase